MNRKLILVCISALLMNSCGVTMKSTWTRNGFTGKDFEKILVVGATRNASARAAFEDTASGLLREQGIAAESSINHFPKFSSIEELSEEMIHEIIGNGGYDGVLVASLVDINSSQVMETHGTNLYPYGMYGVYGFGYGPYIYGSYANAYTTSYVREQKSYIVESRLFDATAATRESAIVWTGQSKLTDPSSFESGAEAFAKTTISTLLKSGVVR